MRVDVCNKCHPIYTGTQRIVDATGQVERFRKRFNLNK
jgi:large subunit ribosomal protein L31